MQLGYHVTAASSLHACLCRWLLPILSAQKAKSGALHMLQLLLDRLGMRMVPYLNLLVVPIMGLTSDSAPAVRAGATSAFAAAVALLPLAQVIDQLKEIAWESLPCAVAHDCASRHARQF